MPGRIVQVVARVLVSTVSGALSGALYAALVGTVHRGTYGRWDQIPAFAVGCVIGGAVLGMLAGMVLVLSSKTAAKRQAGRDRHRSLALSSCRAVRRSFPASLRGAATRPPLLHPSTARSAGTQPRRGPEPPHPDTVAPGLSPDT